MPGRYDRLTVNATREVHLNLFAKFRKLVGYRKVNPTLLELIEAYVNEKEGQK